MTKSLPNETNVNSKANEPAYNSHGRCGRCHKEQAVHLKCFACNCTYWAESSWPQRELVTLQDLMAWQPYPAPDLIICLTIWLLHTTFL